MDKAKLLLELAQKLLKVAEDIRSLADSVQAVCTVVTDSLSGEAKEVPKLPEKEQPTISLEKVRGVISRNCVVAHLAAQIIAAYLAVVMLDIAISCNSDSYAVTENDHTALFCSCRLFTESSA